MENNKNESVTAAALLWVKAHPLYSAFFCWCVFTLLWIAQAFLEFSGDSRSEAGFAATAGDSTSGRHVDCGSSSLHSDTDSAMSAQPFAIPEASRGSMPRSLQGTEVDGAFNVDGGGNFRPDAQALAVFLYFFSASGEESDEIIRGRILLHAQQQVPPSAMADVVDTLDRYIEFRKRMRQLSLSEQGVPEDLALRLESIAGLRMEVMGAYLDHALFGNIDEITRLDLERFELGKDKTLDEGSRAFQLDQIEFRLPEDIRRGREASVAPAKLSNEVAILRAAGADNEEIFRVREQRYGAEAAQRLAELDRVVEAWQSRIDTYSKQKERLIASASGAEQAELDAMIDRLRQDFFSDEEALRVKSLEGAGQL
jgi:lipase chaperone LimK